MLLKRMFTWLQVLPKTSRAIVRFTSMLSGNAVAVLASEKNLGDRTSCVRVSGSFHVIYLGSRDDLAPVASRLSGLRHADHLGASVVLLNRFPEWGWA